MKPTIEHANTLLIEAASTALLHHAKALIAAGVPADAANVSLAAYAVDLEQWRSSTFARIRDEAPVIGGLELGLLRLSASLAAIVAQNRPGLGPPAVSRLVNGMLAQVRAAIEDCG